MTKSNSDPTGQVHAFGERLFRLQEEQRALGEDIRELKREAKGAEVDTKAVTAYAQYKRRGKEKVKAETETRDKVLSILGWLD